MTRRGQQRRRRVVRLVVWDGSAHYQLDPGRTTLRVRIDGDATSDVCELNRAITAQTGLSTAVLRVVAEDMLEVELLGGRLSPNWCWRPASMDPPAESRPPWQCPGWFAATESALDVELERIGLRPTGPPVQVRHNAVTGMLEVPTDGGSVWLKAGLALFRHEARVTRWLGQFAPAAVPHVLVDARQWWVASTFPTAAARPTQPRLTALARLQIATAEHADLRGAGCADRRLPQIVADVTSLLDSSELGDPTMRARLRQALPFLESVVERADSVGIPASIVHGDFNAENARWTNDGWLLYDWTDSCVSHPFVDLAHTIWDDDAPHRAAEIRRYAEQWSRAASAAAVRAAFAFAPTIGAAFQVANYRRIVDGIRAWSNPEPTAAELADQFELWLRRLVFALESSHSAGRAHSASSSATISATMSRSTVTNGRSVGPSGQPSALSKTKGA